MAEVQSNLYEVNKASMAQIKPYDPIVANRLCKKVAAWMYESNGNFWMLLNNERHDYTVFDLNNNATIEGLTSDLLECLRNRGEILDIALQDDNKYEIWLRIDGENYVYYIFDYDWGVIKY